MSLIKWIKQLALFLGVAFLLSSCIENKKQVVKATQKIPLDQFFSKDSQDFAFSIGPLSPLPGVNALKASECGSCHQKHYEEWKQSTHAFALQDLQFQAEITKKDNPRWLCLNCHIPLQNQRQNIVTHLANSNVLKPISTKNPNFDPELRKEAITCATCHIRQDNEGNSYAIGNHGSALAPHPTKKDPAFLQQICTRCHEPKGEQITPNLLCWFQSSKELQMSEEQKNCAACHMPEYRGATASLFDQLPHKNLKSHHWTGSGIPKTFAGFQNLQNRLHKNGLQVNNLSQGEKIHFQLIATSGHHLPTGDPERAILLKVSAFQKDRSIQDTVIEFSQQWNWNPAQKIGDTRLIHGKAYDFKLDLAKLTYDSLILQIWHRRLSPENVRWMKEYPIQNTEDFPSLKLQIQNMENHYPLARALYFQRQKNGVWEKALTAIQLDSLSAGEQFIPLEERPY